MLSWAYPSISSRGNDPLGRPQSSLGVVQGVTHVSRAGGQNSATGSLPGNQLLIMILLSGLLLFGGIIPGPLENYLFFIVGITVAWLAADRNQRARRGILGTGCLVAGIVVVALCLPPYLHEQLRKPLEIFFLMATITFLVYCATIILRRLMYSKAVTPNEVYGTVNLYILIGTFWSYVYSLLELFQPGSFTPPTAPPDVGARFLYFSFVTLATLGYGDITPRMPFAQSLAVLEAIVGQFYLAIVVAYLVSRYVTHELRARNGNSD